MKLTRQIQRADREEWWRYNIDFPRLRPILYVLQDGICSICGERMSLTGSTIDHVIPQSKKSIHTRHLNNLLVAHASCNAAKGSNNPSPSELALLTKVNAEINRHRRAALATEAGRSALKQEGETS